MSLIEKFAVELPGYSGFLGGFEVAHTLGVVFVCGLWFALVGVWFIREVLVLGLLFA